MAEPMQRVAVVTGGGRGIGRGAAVALAADGWSVVVAGRSQDSLDATLPLLGTNGRTCQTDVSDQESVEALFADTVSTFGRLDLLFNNAGIAAPAVAIDELDVAAWTDVVNTNLTGAFLCARAAFAQMRDQDPQGGRIINNGSVSATTPRPFSAPYTSTKHAMTGLTKSLALDGRDLGITCGQINLGNISSEMVDEILQSNGGQEHEATIAVEHAANAVVFMASLPADANVLEMTLMASQMPFVGRG